MKSRKKENFESKIKRLIESNIVSDMEGEDFSDAEESVVDGVISKISTDCGEDISSITSPEDKILFVAKLGDMVGFSVMELNMIFEKLAEHLEGESGEDQFDTDDEEV